MLIILWLSCAKDDQKSSQFDPDILPETLTDTLFSKAGDPIRTGEPIRVKFKKIPLDSVKSSSSQLQAIPEIFPALSETSPAIQPRVTTLPEELPTAEPGVGKFAMPTQHPVRGKILPVKMMPPQEIGPFRFNDDANINIKYLDVDQGMSSSYVSAMLEDSRSNFWIGTSGGGVLRFDGNNLTAFNFKDFGIFTVYPRLEDSDGNIWFETFAHGVICYNGARFVQFGKEEGLLENRNRSIIEDDQRRIWIGANKGVNCLELNEDGITGKVSYYTPDEGLLVGRILALEEDSKGQIWFAGSEGFCRYDGHQFVAITEAEGLSGRWGYSLMEDSKGSIWLGTAAGVSRLSGNTLTHFTEQEGMAGPNITDIHEDERGRIWLSSSGGVSIYDGEKFRIHRVKNADIPMEFTGLMEDSYGNFWFGSQGRGLIKLDLKHNFENFQKIEEDGFAVAQAIELDRNGNYWFGTPGRGIYRFDGKQFYRFSQAEGLAHDFIYSILEDREGRIWIGTRSGLSQLIPDKRGIGGVFSNFPPLFGERPAVIFDLLEDTKGRVWIATSNGLGYFTGETFVDYSADMTIPRMVVFSIFESSTGAIWLGTTNGAVKIETVNNDIKSTFTFITEKEGFGLKGVNDIVEDKKGNLWFAGPEGASYYDGKNFLKVPLKDSWWNHSYRTMGKYNSLLVDSLNRIWISREKELSLIVPKEAVPKQISVEDSMTFNDLYQIFNFGKDDGIFTFEMYARSVLLDDKNRIWWGGGPYCVRLDLNEFQLPQEPPRMNLNHIEIRQQFVDFRSLSDSLYRDTIANHQAIMASFDSVVPFRNYPETLDLPYDLNHLTFHFSATDWADPTAIRYRFRIEGLEEGWSQPQASPRADYRNLPPGEHQLLVQAIGKAQKWSAPFVYSFRIRPPWWQTRWAYLLWILLAGTLVMTIYRYQLKRKLALAENERLLELDQVKSRLFTNITHEFRTPLTIILGMADQIRSRPEKWLEPGSEMIRRNGRQVLHLVNQMLDLARIESATLDKKMVQANVISYLKYLAESFQSLAITRRIRLYFIAEMETYRMDFEPTHLMQIVTNLLTNALKFTPAGGEVHFRTKEIKKSAATYLQICIRDTGEGIAPENQSKIFDRFYQVNSSGERMRSGTGIGLALTKELIELHGGSIEVSSKVGIGTEFTVLLPVGHAAPLVELLEGELLDNNLLPLATSGLESGPELETETSGTVKEDANELLIVEDNTDVVRYLQACLRGHYELIIARNGTEGIQLATDRVPDIIISDVMMPGKSGFELCQTLKSDEKTSHIPIILLTAKGDLDSKVYGLSHGADVYLPKPFYEKELLAHLENLIVQRQKLQTYYQRILKGIAPADPTPHENPFLTKVLQLVEANLDQSELDIQSIADQMFVTRVQLFRKIKALTGSSPSQFIRSYRLRRGKQLLLGTQLSVAEIAYRTGFSDPSYFSKTFKDEFGVSPSAIRKDNLK
ncbi:hybrid sensor histidine kinase/response regulator transcription factor [Flavilitoribacter nigricans]|uniref:hybrid sensor histidine kinase/response regulator transcription factor n=1 Tax=Flavilitoribacter nigricans TaxID=70997 RepID=UPI00147652CB|nr:two-component regulator propeller domain-containing protein [Flavilitoribacter nigricans]